MSHAIDGVVSPAAASRFVEEASMPNPIEGLHEIHENCYGRVARVQSPLPFMDKGNEL